MVKTDFQYTAGFKFTWTSPDLSEYEEQNGNNSHKITVMKHLPLMSKPGRLRTVSLSLIHLMYTPRNIESCHLIDDDRPYAGITQAAIGFHSRNERLMDTLELDLGILGPHSYAENVQRGIHKLFDCPRPMGWEYQLDDELLLNLFYERKWRLGHIPLSEHTGIDFIPHAGAALGNAYTGINTGGQVRFGWNLPNDFGTYTIRPGSDSNAPINDKDPRFFRRHTRFGMHVFAGLEGYAVIRDVTLDGNTFRESHHVDKNPFVADIIAGAGFLFSRYKITYAHVYKTKTFQEQKEGQAFGSFTFSLSF